VRAVVEEDKDYAMRVLSMNEDMARLALKADLHQAQRLVSEDSGKFAAYSVEIEIIEKLKRIYYHAKRMAKTVAASDIEEVVVAEAA
jgi:phosphate:Na+ symporter